MSRFPFFKEISAKRVLVVGGGEVALRRARVMSAFGAQVTCIAPEFCDGFSSVKAECICRKIEPGDICGWDIVLAATDNHGLNASIAGYARAQGSETSVADDPESSTFLFPGIVQRGGMTIAVSSGGTSPLSTKYVREQIESAIPENFENVLESMEMARRLAKMMIPDQKVRAAVLREIFDCCIHNENQPDEDEIETMIRHFHGTELD